MGRVFVQLVPGERVGSSKTGASARPEHACQHVLNLHVNSSERPFLYKFGPAAGVLYA